MTRQAKTTPLTQDQMLAIAKQYWDDHDIPGTWEKMQERLCSLPKDESDRLIKVIQREHWSRMEQRRPRSVPRHSLRMKPLPPQHTTVN